ncbi:membrane-anchored junction protein isoform X2 [Xenopus tropicalis]|uniref:Membrane-anchored junction protein isoform X2 n=1 Tax=Xenopus tropicalis TaxID=8364 RepID=A0A8J1JHA1_XENTR|nr:membrane-anchored junction protein isoform X2 [Xenopus tropicalis]
MPIKPFSFPLPETRFFHTEKDVYKFKFHYGTNFTTEDTKSKEHLSKEIVDSIRAVLANYENLHPFCTDHLIVFPCPKQTELGIIRKCCHSRDTEEQSGNLTEKDDDEDMNHDESGTFSDEAVTQKPKCPDQADQDECPSSDFSGETGGILRFLSRLNPLQILFRGWKHI